MQFALQFLKDRPTPNSRASDLFTHRFFFF